MIRQINIHGIATYSKPVKMHPLNINFIYGSNGSGKSTLANLLDGNIASAGSNIVWETNQLPVLVYNKNFIEANFGANTLINGVFTLGQDSKEAQGFITQKREEEKACDYLISKQMLAIEQLKQDQAILDTNLDDICWAVQQNYGTEFSDALVGYRGSKRSFRDKCLEEYSRQNLEASPALQEIRELYKVAYGEKRESYSLYQEFDSERVKQQEECSLLMKRITGSVETPVGKFIEFLNNSDWVKSGIGYSEKAEGKCPYCQRILPTSIQQDIEAFFDEAYTNECNAVREFEIEYTQFTDRLLYQLNESWEKPISLLNYELYKAELDVLVAQINANRKILQDKINSPSAIVSIKSIEPLILRINHIISEFNLTIRRNNEIVQNQSLEKERCKNLLWQYFSYELRQPIEQYKKNYEGKTKGINSLSLKLQEQSQKKKEIEKQIEEKESTLSSVKPTVNAINAILTRFGFEGFHLIENTDKKGTYGIVRSDGTSARQTLSEGEYNFITFLYFYHLVYGSQTKKGILTDKVVVIDDPISSLDSNVLFIITTLVKSMLQDCKIGNNGIQQMFVLTHNVYFHKEITFLGAREQYPPTKTAYWVLNKINNITAVIKHEQNPIQTSYELLWAEIKDASKHQRVTVFNTLRRILEFYFNIIGGMDYEKCINEFDGEDKIICKALISCINDGSHFISDDFVMCYEKDTIDKYLRVFKLIFEKMNHSSHYKMMMGQLENTA